jgi:class 3 adenylate cyclase
MLTVIQYVLNPYISNMGLPTFKCALGMEFGETWIERVGIRGENQLTLVGRPVSIASQLQELAKPSHILLAHLFFSALSADEQKRCIKQEPDVSWKWTSNQQVYPYYDYTGIFTGYELSR